jgi:hypothetical protein
VLAPSSDIERLVKRILPLLPSGPSVHCYDIFPLEAYPVSWATSLYN